MLLDSGGRLSREPGGRVDPEGSLHRLGHNVLVYILLMVFVLAVLILIALILGLLVFSLIIAIVLSSLSLTCCPP